jgi:hypothetical protein
VFRHATLYSLDCEYWTAAAAAVTAATCRSDGLLAAVDIAGDVICMSTTRRKHNAKTPKKESFANVSGLPNEKRNHVL